MANLENLEYSKLLDRQNELLKTTLHYLYKYSPYYRYLFNVKHITDLNSITLSNLNKLPVTDKNTLTEQNRNFFCVNLSEASDIVSTSGSTSNRPIINPLTQSDLTRLAYNEKVSFQKAGIKKDDLILLATALDGSFVAGLAYYLGFKEIGANIIRAGSKNLRLQYEILSKYQVTVIVGVPSNVVRLYEFCQENGLDLSSRKIAKLILIGEAIRGENFKFNQIGKRLNEYFPNTIIYSTYANTETCSSFCECEYGKGGHLNPDLAYAEIIDDKGNLLSDNQVGHLVITTFGTQGMPLLRYDTGDLTFMEHGKCRCGRTTPRIGPILGRKEGICKINGITFNLAALGEAVLSIPEIKDYCIIVKNDKNGASYLTIHYFTQSENKTIINLKIKEAVWEKIRISARITPCSYEELINIQQSKGARKPVRFIIK